MYKKIIGSILMLLGTSVGAGMLALPIVSAHESVMMTMLLLFFSWFIMTVGAYSLLEVNLWLKSDTNMVSMAGHTIGPWGKFFTWIVYLLLLYSLICAYLSGLSDILQSLLMSIHINIPIGIAIFLVLSIFGTIVYRGIRAVDLLNRGFMLVKLAALFILIAVMSQHLNINLPFEGDYRWHNSVFMVMLASFGYAIIIPSLRHYLDDEKILKKVVLIGSLIPPVIYAIWILMIQGLISKTGTHGLINMLNSDNTNSMLMTAMTTKINSSLVTELIKLFISICAVTSFLGVSVCLTDFISDGLSIPKKSKYGIVVYLLAFLPPFFIVLISPGIFVTALHYAGIWCLLLLIIIPVMMLYWGRYKRGFTENKLLPGKGFLLGFFSIGIYLLVLNILQV
ncbi:MAG TPA: aromatic amino acid transport family protein [Gammaproteobacteria bacterium]|nr:aromatic amino acid transport family protein [Gammaproteobacteria bacterium]